MKPCQNRSTSLRSFLEVNRKRERSTDSQCVNITLPFESVLFDRLFFDRLCQVVQSCLASSEAAEQTNYRSDGQTQDPQAHGQWAVFRVSPKVTSTLTPGKFLVFRVGLRACLFFSLLSSLLVSSSAALFNFIQNLSSLRDTSCNVTSDILRAK